MIMFVVAIIAIIIVQRLLDEIMPRGVQFLLLFLGIPIIFILALSQFGGGNPPPATPTTCSIGICDSTHK